MSFTIRTQWAKYIRITKVNFKMKYGYFTLLIFSILMTACTSRQIIRDSEYKHSEAAFKSGDTSQALELFPKKENGGFVTSIEKSWIALWNNEKNHDSLMKQSKTLDERNYTSILRETEYFFYSESEDGYIPAEHEIIIMHLINAMYFLKNQQWEQARVEARRSTFFLQNYFKEDQSHFDDPALRLWLAGIWAALGEWQEAQVDLRKTYELSKNPALLPLIEMQRPPESLNIFFEGTGPRVVWREDVAIPEYRDESSPPTAEIRFSTLPWFLRHEQRNSKIRSIVMNSNYMAQYYELNTAVGAEKGIGLVASNSLRAAGLITGAVIIGGGIYLLIQSGASSGSGDAVGYIFGAGFIAGTALWEKGNEISRNFERSSAESKQKGLENMRTYRFVRFMPSWIYLEKEGAYLESALPSASNLVFQSPNSKTKVVFVQKF